VTDRETWYLPSPDGEGTLVLGAHPRGDCAGRGCALHGPTDHWAAGMPLRWTAPVFPDTGGPPVKPGVMERLCPHGQWHEDPDDLDYRKGMASMRGLRVAASGSRDMPCQCGCPCECPWEPPF
jgi:hypothetical protein